MWPWLLLLGVFALGGSFAVVFTFTNKRRVSSTTAAEQSSRSPKSIGEAPSETVASTLPAPAFVSATGSASHVVPSLRPPDAVRQPPPATVPITSGPLPATVSSTKMSGAVVRRGGSEMPGCALRDLPSDWHFEGRTPQVHLVDIARASVDQCFAQAQFDPPEHEQRNYVVWFDAQGKVTNVGRFASEPLVPRLDACIARALQPTELGKLREACWGRVTFMSQ
jgi:hypothetical protein